MSDGSPSRTRTCDPMINSHLLYQLSYRGITGAFRQVSLERFGSSSRTRTCDPMINSHLLYQLSYRGIA